MESYLSISQTPSAVEVKINDVKERPRVAETELLPLEQTFWNLKEDPISTITWFRGDCHQKVPLLRERVRLVLAANPWLVGRIVKRKKALLLTYPTEWKADDESGSQLVHLLDQSVQLAHDMPMIQMARTAMACHNQKCEASPLFKITVAPCSKSPTDYYAVVFGLSHVIADGHTYYTILHMLLDPSAPIFPLIAERIQETIQLQEEAMGGTENSMFLQSKQYIAPLVLGSIHERCLRWMGRPKRYDRFIRVDPDKVDSIKKSLLSDHVKTGDSSDSVPFLSTNDILTSWFFQATTATIGCMAINFRSRLVGHTERHAGNYENVITYTKKDYASPMLIRQSIPHVRRAGNEQPLPTVRQMMRRPRISIMSSWVSFKRDAPDEILHLPVGAIDIPRLPSNLPVAIAFQNGKKETMLYVTCCGKAGRRMMKKTDFEA